MGSLCSESYIHGAIGGRIKLITEGDRILKDFFSLKENRSLYNAYLENPGVENRKNLDEQFRKHFYRVRCISYFLKMIHFESRHFDKRQRRRNEKFQLILDKQTKEDHQKLIDLVPDNQNQEDPACNLEDAVERVDLYNSIQKLNDRQKRLLKLIFVEGMKDTEVAEIFGVTQQAITKAKRNILNKLRKELT